MKIKILGERNTGTNYLQRIVQENLKVDMLRGVTPPWYLWTVGSSERKRDFYFRLTAHRNLGWKHASAPVRDLVEESVFDRTVFLVLVKNPYSWLRSLYKKPYHGRSAPSFREFLESPWRTHGRERCGGKVFASPMELWNAKMGSYARLMEKAAYESFRYEDLIASPNAVIDRFRTHFALPKRENGFVNMAVSTKGDPKDFSFYQDYYLKEKWKHKYDRTALDVANRSLDTGLMALWNYSTVSADELPPPIQQKLL